MISRVPCTVSVNESHTAENLENRLKDIADEWNISSKIAAITTDNAANIVAAVRDWEWRHLPCFAHTLN